MRVHGLVPPVLAAAFPILFLYAHNVDMVTASYVVPLLLAAVAGAALLTLLLWRCFQDGTQASLVGTVWVLLFFLYGHIYNQASGISPLAWVLGRHEVLLPALLAVAALPLLPMFPIRRLGPRFMPSVAVALAALVAFNLVIIGVTELRRLDQARVGVGTIEGMAPDLTTTDQPPDIYYIVPDRYPSNRVLEEYFNYDNTEFIKHLEDSGFYIADKSFTNYPSTFLSLASSLNMEYLDTLSEEVGEDTGDHTPAYAMMEDNRVWRTLKEQHGYRYIHFGSWWEPTARNPHADVEINLRPWLLGLVELNTFSQMLLRTTLLAPFQGFLLHQDKYTQDEADVRRCAEFKVEVQRTPNDQATAQCHHTLHTFQQLREMPRVEGPKFVFVHLMIPHPPFIFGPTGELVDPPPFYYWDNPTDEEVEIIKRRKLDQLTFTNIMLQETIDHILAESPQSPVIILQADEGPWTKEFMQRAPGDWSPETFHTRYGILNAYHLPGEGSEALYPSISPVNSFRVVFSEYFGADLPLLEDRAYLSESSSRIYRFMEVTDKIRDE